MGRLYQPGCKVIHSSFPTVCIRLCQKMRMLVTVTEMWIKRDLVTSSGWYWIHLSCGTLRRRAIAIATLIFIADFTPLSWCPFYDYGWIIARTLSILLDEIYYYYIIIIALLFAICWMLFLSVVTWYMSFLCKEANQRI